TLGEVAHHTADVEGLRQFAEEVRLHVVLNFNVHTAGLSATRVGLDVQNLLHDVGHWVTTYQATSQWALLVVTVVNDQLRAVWSDGLTEVELEPVDCNLQAVNPLSEGRRVDEAGGDGVTLLGLQAGVRRRQNGQRVVGCAVEHRVEDAAATGAREEAFAEVRFAHVTGLGVAPTQVFVQLYVYTDLPAVDGA